MLKNYLKIALRNLRKQACYTFINIAVLTADLIALATVGYQALKASLARFAMNSEVG